MQRDIYQNQKVTNTVARQAGPVVTHDAEIQASAEVQQKIIEVGEQAKINENFSTAQLALNKMQSQYEIDNQSNPYGGVEKLKAARNKLFTDLGSQISPYYRGEWNQNVQQLQAKHDQAVDTWAITQTKKNTVTSINKSIKNNLLQASIAGQNFANGDATDVSAALDFTMSRDKLAGFGDKHLGHETTTNMLEDYQGDYLKSFLSGVSENDPVKALKLMDDPHVKAGFAKDPSQYEKMKNAIEHRALNAQEVYGQKQVLNVMKDENSVLGKSLQQPMSYAELQTAFSAQPGMSEYAKNYFMKANGFSKGSEKLTPSEKLKGQGQLYDDMNQLFTPADKTWYGSKKGGIDGGQIRDGITAKDISDFQGKIYQSLDNGTIDKDTAASYLSHIVEPLASQQEDGLKNFATQNGAVDGLGMAGVKEYFDNKVAIVSGDKDLGDITQHQNDQNKVNLYSGYFAALRQQADTRGIKVGELSKLPPLEKQEVYATALDKSVKSMHVASNPALATLNDLPNQVFKDGQLIPGVLGERDLKPNATVAMPFRLQLGKDGMMYRLFNNGERRPANMPAPPGVKF